MQNKEKWIICSPKSNSQNHSHSVNSATLNIFMSSGQGELVFINVHFNFKDSLKVLLHKAIFSCNLPVQCKFGWKNIADSCSILDIMQVVVWPAVIILETIFLVTYNLKRFCIARKNWSIFVPPECISIWPKFVWCGWFAVMHFVPSRKCTCT